MKIVQDVFPALIVLGTEDTTTPIQEMSVYTRGTGFRQVNTARIVITDRRVIIATDSSDGPIVVFNQEIDPASHFKNPDRAEHSYVTTLGGVKIVFKKDTSCGCGSRLKSWAVSRYMSSSKDPE